MTNHDNNAAAAVARTRWLALQFMPDLADSGKRRGQPELSPPLQLFYRHRLR
jgi:hypothetical protein